MMNNVCRSGAALDLAGDPFWERQLTALLEQPSEQMGPNEKAELLYNTAATITRRAMADVSQEMLVDVDKLIDSMVRYVLSDKSALSALLSAMLHDFSVHTHVLNVAVYSLELALFMGITNFKILKNLGVAAILCDIGMTKIPEEILNKPGQLSPEEWVMMRQHPEIGVELLSGLPGLPGVVLAVVAQHHERLDGSGYPVGIAGNKLHQFSRIVAIADCYDALTCDRPHRPMLTPFAALSILKNEGISSGKLDHNAFAALVRLLR